MPISSKAFDSTPDSINPKLMDLFIKNPNQAYSFPELSKKFGGTIIIDLITLNLLNKIDIKSLNGDSYYRLKK